MRHQWDGFARRDPMFYIATRRRPWTREEFFRSGASLAESCLRWAGPVQRRRMLEIGCGIGRTAVHFAAHFDRVDAVDISPAMIEQARSLQPPPNVHFAASSGADLSGFGDAGFDLVFCSLVFQHVRSTHVIAGYLREIARVLAPQGRAVLQFDTRPATLLSRLYEAMPLVPGRRRGRYLRRYRRRSAELRRFIALAPLRILDERDPDSARHCFLLAPEGPRAAGP